MTGNELAHRLASQTRGNAVVAARVGSVLLPASVLGGFAAVGHPLLGTLPAALVACAQFAWQRRRARLEQRNQPESRPGAARVDPPRWTNPHAGARGPALESATDAPIRVRARDRRIRDFDVAQRDVHELPALALRHLLELHDPVTGSHLARLPEYTRILVDHVAQHPRYRHALTDGLLEVLPEASTLHDVGKLNVPRQLLQKAGRLTVEEFTVMKRHTTSGGRALRELERRSPGNRLLTIAEQIAMYHHERWDGSGYPFGLRGTQIPIAARVVAVADVYDALTSVRSYKPAYGHEESRRFIVSQSGSHFDPDVIEAFVRCEQDFPAVRRSVMGRSQPPDGRADDSQCAAPLAPRDAAFRSVCEPASSTALRAS